MRGIEQLALQFRFHLVIPLTVIFVILRRKRMTIYWKTIQIAFTSSSLFIVSCFKHQNCSVLIRSDYIVQLSKKKKKQVITCSHLLPPTAFIFSSVFLCLFTKSVCEACPVLHICEGKSVKKQSIHKKQ